jgi:hypothetical protein
VGFFGALGGRSHLLRFQCHIRAPPVIRCLSSQKSTFRRCPSRKCPKRCAKVHDIVESTTPQDPTMQTAVLLSGNCGTLRGSRPTNCPKQGFSDIVENVRLQHHFFAYFCLLVVDSDQEGKLFPSPPPRSTSSLACEAWEPRYLLPSSQPEPTHAFGDGSVKKPAPRARISSRDDWARSRAAFGDGLGMPGRADSRL